MGRRNSRVLSSTREDAQNSIEQLQELQRIYNMKNVELSKANSALEVDRRGRYESVRSDLLQAKSEYSRAKAEMEQAKSQANQARAGLKRAEEALSNAREELAGKRDGTRYHERGSREK